MPIKTSRLDSDRTTNHLNKRMVKNEGFLDGDDTTYIDSGDIVAITGVSGSYVTVSRADGNGADKLRDQLWVTLAELREFGEVSRWAVLDFDTSASSVGNPVYLSDTAGNISLTAGTNPVVVGKVLSVAVAGEVSIDLLAPQPIDTMPIADAAASLAATQLEAVIAELATGVSLTAAVEAGQAIAVTVAGPAHVAAYRATVRRQDGTVALVAAFTAAETGPGVEISTTANPVLLFRTAAAGTATVAVTDVSGVFAGTVYLEVEPIVENVAGVPGPKGGVGAFLAITFA